MRAVCWQGTEKVAVETVPDPGIVNPRDCIVRITSSAICGSDLHLYDGFIPTLKAGDILGHEFMGEVVEIGRDVHNLKKGDRVVVPFTISCGQCFFCKKELWALCDNTNPNAALAEKLYGYSGGGLFGYSHLYGSYFNMSRNEEAGTWSARPKSTTTSATLPVRTSRPRIFGPGPRRY